MNREQAKERKGQNKRRPVLQWSAYVIEIKKKKFVASIPKLLAAYHETEDKRIILSMCGL